MIAIVRVRGSIGTRWDIKKAFRLLRLKTCNQLSLLPESKQAFGMIRKVQDYATFGKISEKTLARLLEKRARLAGNKRLSLEALKEKKTASFEELAKKIIEGKSALKDFGIKPVFRLSPPKKGFERQGIKKPFKLGGALGDRGEKINELIERMV
ncbi:MAG: 50S ribosomal protein L30 [Candidatus Diapherotrites archaeon]|uniref:Large ribosomal subunit protein uL30 n=1 Tax=Candidatus Iainarchaeum sp. TaxID=3101447 RepID=A0A7J4KY58_9ARCH|nr:MAG: 50S ribosomal protein L30, large subunit ribosomal protein L30 [archaeon GW2011_AR21]MBS3058289.1 50S ribosomal protein L30 [Candidatus Diapherotrites archaeon]HIH21258.1 50S ribosomal protein L30 [Candidatus Diapherotrites archaeon]HIH33237.1 50S ribosomal protein L30 [Candidatus Diapherotrites archaeon]